MITRHGSVSVAGRHKTTAGRDGGGARAEDRSQAESRGCRCQQGPEEGEKACWNVRRSREMSKGGIAWQLDPEGPETVIGLQTLVSIRELCGSLTIAPFTSGDCSAT